MWAAVKPWGFLLLVLVVASTTAQEQRAQPRERRLPKTMNEEMEEHAAEKAAIHHALGHTHNNNPPPLLSAEAKRNSELEQVLQSHTYGAVETRSTGAGTSSKMDTNAKMEDYVKKGPKGGGGMAGDDGSSPSGPSGSSTKGPKGSSTKVPKGIGKKGGEASLAYDASGSPSPSPATAPASAPTAGAPASAPATTGSEPTEEVNTEEQFSGRYCMHKGKDSGHHPFALCHPLTAINYLSFSNQQATLWNARWESRPFCLKCQRVWNRPRLTT